MKTFTYMAICLCLPFVVLAEDGEKDEVETSPGGVAAEEEAAPDPDFERFKTILDRMPCGRPPPGFDPDAPGGAGESRRGSEDAAAESEVEASEIEQQILSSVRVSVLNVTPAGKVVVGFTDSSVQPAKNYLLEVGEKREQCEWQVVDADPASRQVKLSKGGVEATLMLGGGSGPVDEKKDKSGEEGGMAVARPGLFRGRPNHMASGASGASDGAEGKLTGLDLARARRQRTIQMQQAEAEQKRQAAEQAEKERRQLAQEREQAAEERKAQLAQLMQIQEELRRQREEKLAEQERRAAAEEAAPPSETPVPSVE